jgi:threonine aldolase
MPKFPHRYKSAAGDIVLPAARSERFPAGSRKRPRDATRLPSNGCWGNRFSMHFASDNAAGVAPPILDAILRANEGYALAYGADTVTARVKELFSEVFERELEVFLVATGTAANALAIAQLAPPWGAVLCHREAHIAVDECGAPEFFGGGLKLVGLTGEAGKITPGVLKEALAGGPWGGPHHMTPAVLSLPQATEAGTVYRPAEVAALAALAHEQGLSVHMDGARLANVLARLGATPAEVTWKVGVDVLSLGATKGGALAAEAIVFFDPAQAAAMDERRKRGGHLVSKHRFIAAQFEAFFAGDLWLDLARHSNACADRLAAGLTRAGFAPVWPVEANEVFVMLPRTLDRRLQAAGASYHPWRSQSLPHGVRLTPEYTLVRLVTSHATTQAEIDRFLALLHRA